MKFLVIIAILYCGFFVTFWSLGRDAYTISQMGWLLVRIFFGSSYIGFDSMHKFGLFGPTLMYCTPHITFLIIKQDYIRLSHSDCSHHCPHLDSFKSICQIQRSGSISFSLWYLTISRKANIISVCMRGIDKLRSHLGLLSSHKSSPIAFTSAASFIPTLPPPLFAAIEIHSAETHTRSVCTGCNNI